MLLRARKSEEGFGLIELLMSMTMLNVGILALIAAFQSGAFALQRASKLSTAAAIADIQLERYRGYKYCGILFAAADVGSLDTTYTQDRPPTRAAAHARANDPKCMGVDGSRGLEAEPDDHRAGLKRYRVDVYIAADSVTAARPHQARDRRDPGRQHPDEGLRAVASTFDEATGS